MVSYLILFARLLAGGVWLFHGFYSKILGGIPRHEMIVERILGTAIAPTATLFIGLGEIVLGLWALSGRLPRTCATAQTLAILTMNTLEILLAQDLLISATGMLTLNALFLTIVWFAAIHSSQPR
jgi:uncharacterized membrane protein YphA (DoxX/SURF4 family)